MAAHHKAGSQLRVSGDQGARAIAQRTAKAKQPTAGRVAKRTRPEAAKEPRVARRKREARARLLDAALQLMAARGADGVAIHEITEAADMAIGGFYNHFKSKDDIYLEVTRRVFEDFADALDLLVATLDDPAEVIAVCIRQTLSRARSEPVWAQFLTREGLSGDAAHRGLGRRLRRDIKAGIERGRFKVSDPALAFIATGGAVLGAVAAQLHAPKIEPDMGERIAMIALQILGLTHKQAERVARKPFPDAPAGLG